MIRSQAVRQDPQSLAIRRATERAVRARNSYVATVAGDLVETLVETESGVKRALRRYTSLGSLPENKLKARRGLKRLQAEIRDVLADVRRRQMLMFRGQIKKAFRLGIAQGIDEFVEGRIPQYSGLSSSEAGRLAKDGFALIDRSALDFMINYSLVLAGDVNRELASGIERVLLSGIATGKGVPELVRELGDVVKNPADFRKAGTKVFTSARYRLEMIARTETLRAHNQGRLKFHREVGVKRLEWMTMDDERSCPVCRPLDGKVYALGRFPAQPAHPNCRCTNVVAEPFDFLGPEALQNRAKRKVEQSV